MDEQKQPLNPNERFESDSHKLVQKHLSDQHHQITDEELANVRIGASPEPDAPPQKAVSKAEERISDNKTINDENTVPGAQKITPWDTIDP